MHPYVLFVERYKRLGALIQSTREIDIIDASACLRQILLDKHSLINVANVRKKKIVFVCGAFDQSLVARPPLLASLEDGIDPFTSVSPRGAVELSPSEFIAHPVMIIMRNPISIKDVIKNAANVAGGVHYDPHPKPAYEKLAQFGALFQIGGLPAGVRILKAISRVALRGLEPLVEDVEAHR
jgi:hypothetical protein